MARSFLTKEHEIWLYDNYRNTSNEELASVLTKKVSKENDKQIELLSKVLENVTQKSIRRRIERELKWRRSFKGLTATYVKHAALRLKCPQKSFTLISKMSKERARKTNIIRWRKKAAIVKHPYEWLKTFFIGETRICLVQSKQEIIRVRNAVNNFNRIDSESYGFNFSTEHVKDTDLLRVHSVRIIR